MQGSNKPQKVPDFILKLRDHLKETLHDTQHQMTAEMECQKCYYDKTMSSVVLVTGDMVLLKLDASIGRRKINDWWDNKPYTIIQQMASDVLVYEIRDN